MAPHPLLARRDTAAAPVVFVAAQQQQAAAELTTGLSTPLIVAIAVGAVVVLALLYWFTCRPSASGKDTKKAADRAIPTASESTANGATGSRPNSTHSTGHKVMLGPTPVHGHDHAQSHHYAAASEPMLVAVGTHGEGKRPANSEPTSPSDGSGGDAGILASLPAPNSPPEAAELPAAESVVVDAIPERYASPVPSVSTGTSRTPNSRRTTMTNFRGVSVNVVRLESDSEKRASTASENFLFIPTASGPLSPLEPTPLRKFETENTAMPPPLLHRQWAMGGSPVAPVPRSLTPDPEPTQPLHPLLGPATTPASVRRASMGAPISAVSASSFGQRSIESPSTATGTSAAAAADPLPLTASTMRALSAHVNVAQAAARDPALTPTMSPMAMALLTQSPVPSSAALAANGHHGATAAADDDVEEGPRTPGVEAVLARILASAKDEEKAAPAPAMPTHAAANAASATPTKSSPLTSEQPLRASSPTLSVDSRGVAVRKVPSRASVEEQEDTESDSEVEGDGEEMGDARRRTVRFAAEDVVVSVSPRPEHGQLSSDDDDVDDEEDGADVDSTDESSDDAIPAPASTRHGGKAHMPADSDEEEDDGVPLGMLGQQAAKLPLPPASPGSASIELEE